MYLCSRYNIKTICMSISRFNAVEKASNRKAVEAITPNQKVSEYYGENVFNRKAMQKYLSKETYKALTHAIDNGTPIDREIANHVAAGMRMWALEKGVTHYTHWFQPLTDGTAEKHDAFVEHDGGGGMIEEFSGKLLAQQEPDASSFPNGGLRNTFEARGYSAWDPSSPAFIVDDTLCIPTVFIAYTGEALDYKTPLIRSIEALNKAAKDVCHYFNEDVNKVITYLGWEQEYFLVDEDLYSARPDLSLTERTLLGHESAKNQQLDDHYFGVIKPRVAAYMADLNEELWKLGVLAKTEHNEVAPSQHELAPIYTTTNIATDHNQLTMEIMQKVAAKHGLVCLLHEKPFAGVNGSGKHNNWSMATDTGVNLLTPGETPYENAQFLLFLCAVIKAVDDYQDLLRVSVATAGNDHRLGANEAPPAVVSMFLGDELTAVLDAIENDAPYSGSEKTTMKLGVHVLPKFTRDTTDRNRTSPFAFTGNKFEFRMLGSSNSIACANIMLNAAVAESLKIYADRLENVDDFETALHDMIKKTIKDHKRIIFNGNGYDDAWIKEATEERGLLNLRTTPDAMPAMIADKNVKMLTAHKIFSPAELHSRYEILLENYSKTVNIEALTMVDMARKEILPAVEGYTKSLAETLAAKKAAVAGLPCKYETATITKLSELSDEIADATADLDSEIAKFQAIEDVTEAANDIRDVILGKMDALRAVCDEAETITAKEFWPFPTYSDLLFSVK